MSVNYIDTICTAELRASVLDAVYAYNNYVIVVCLDVLKRLKFTE